MEFRLTFNMDNEAFAGDGCDEAARILREVANKVEAGRTEGSIMDANGNNVGTWEVSE